MIILLHELRQNRRHSYMDPGTWFSSVMVLSGSIRVLRIN